jgi:outer membrane receptor protein involved in Fe transport
MQYSKTLIHRRESVPPCSVIEGSAGVFASNDTQWTDDVRSIVGLRYDRYRFDVTSLGTPENSGDVSPPSGHRRCRWCSAPGQDRVFRQRRLWLPQQRRARRDDPYRSRDRRSGGPGDAAGA